MKNMLLLALLLVSITANADWSKAMNSTTNGPNVYVDLDKINKKGSFVKMWSMNDYQQPKLGPNNVAYSSMKTYNEYDCSLRTIRLLAGVISKGNMGAGDIVYSNMTPSSESEPIVPESQGEYMWQLACGKR